MIGWSIPTNALDRLSAVYDREVISRDALTLHKAIKNGCEVTFVAEHFPFFGPSLPWDLPNNSYPEAQNLNVNQVVVIKVIWPPDWIEQNEETFIERLNSDPGEEPKLGIKKTTDFDALMPYWHRLREQLTERGVTAETDTHQRLILSNAVSREMKRSTLKGEFGEFYRRNWREITYLLDDGSVSSFAPLSGSLTLAFRSEAIFEFEEALLDHRHAECP